ncbi:hypothetical protein D041_0281 [Vibrio parahaemolyticus EKP-008]|nr:hypothetical protein D041_0281 [Vibrio parahaemolyticus EKP-008]
MIYRVYFLCKLDPITHRVNFVHIKSLHNIDNGVLSSPL